MLNTIILALAAPLLALGSAVEPRQSCNFRLTASGSASGTVGQRSSGQVVFGSVSTATFTVRNGYMYDSAGRSCFFTPPSNVLQCDAAQQSANQFAIACDGTLSYAGVSVLYQCPAGGGVYNIYQLRYNGGDGCGSVTLKADACYPASCSQGQGQAQPAGQGSTAAAGSGAAAGAAAAAGGSGAAAGAAAAAGSGGAAAGAGAASSGYQPPAQPAGAVAAQPAAQPATNSGGTSPAPATIGGTFEFPHLILPLDRVQTSLVPGTSLFGLVTTQISSIFNFDIPGSYSGRTCNLVFLFPQQSQLQTSSFTLTGSGVVSFVSLRNSVNPGTAYKDIAIATDYGARTLVPGTAYAITSFACPAGQAIAFGIRVPTGQNTYFRYFQDYNPAPIGLYIQVV